MRGKTFLFAGLFVEAESDSDLSQQNLGAESELYQV